MPKSSELRVNAPSFAQPNSRAQVGSQLPTTDASLSIHRPHHLETAWSRRRRIARSVLHGPVPCWGNRHRGCSDHYSRGHERLVQSSRPEVTAGKERPHPVRGEAKFLCGAGRRPTKASLRGKRECAICRGKKWPHPVGAGQGQRLDLHMLPYRSKAS